MSDKEDKTPVPPVAQELGSLPIAKIMTRKVLYATATTSIRSAIQIMITHKVSGLPIIDSSERCIGIFSELDAMVQGASRSLGSTIEFTPNPTTVGPDETFRDVLVVFIKNRRRRLPVVDPQGRLLGVVARRDLIKALFGQQQTK